MAISDDPVVWRADLRLMPLHAAPLPVVPWQRRQPPSLSDDHRVAVRTMMRRCALALGGDRPLEAMRRCSSRDAFRQFTRLRHRLDCRPGTRRPLLRASHTAIDHNGDLDIVATVRCGGDVCALAIRMCQHDQGWRLTQCDMVG